MNCPICGEPLKERHGTDRHYGTGSYLQEARCPVDPKHFFYEYNYRGYDLTIAGRRIRWRVSTPKMMPTVVMEVLAMAAEAAKTASPKEAATS